MLRRFADARLAARLAEATQLVRRLDGLRRQQAAEARTNYDLAQRWKSIAQQAQADLAEERAERQEIGRRLGLAAERVELLRTQLTQQQETHR